MGGLAAAREVGIPRFDALLTDTPKGSATVVATLHRPSSSCARIFALAAPAAVAALALSLWASAPAASPSPRLAPSFTLPARAGTVSLDSLRGKVVLVDFWASWCAPCRGSFPWLSRVADRYAADGFTVVAVNLDKDRAAADRFLEEFPAPFAVAFDSSGRTAEKYRVTVMPTSFLVARDGTILHTHSGFDPKKVAAVENLIQEACRR